MRKTCEEAISINGGGRKLVLAFFGGSFTAIDRGYMLELLEAAKPYIGNGIDSIRISTRPDAINSEILELLYRYNVRAIEIGAQSMNDNVLKQNRRGHTVDDIITGSKLIKDYGFELGLQIMLGLPGETEIDCEKLAGAVIECKPDTVRIYPALVIKGIELEKMYISGEYRPLCLEKAINYSAKLMEIFENANVKVIRAGLHANKELEAKLVAGPYHPAFRELCESEIMLTRVLKTLEQSGKTDIIITVNSSDLSKMIGNKRRNILKLEQLGYSVQILTDSAISPLRPQLR